MRRIFLVFVLGLVGCYASEKAGKDIQDTSHDVRQGGIHMDHGALGVRRPPPPTLTSAPLTTITSAPLPSVADGGVAAEAGAISM